jgi:hypothetical protein
MYEILLSNKLHLSLGYSQMRIQLEEKKCCGKPAKSYQSASGCVVGPHFVTQLYVHARRLRRLLFRCKWTQQEGYHMQKIIVIGNKIQASLRKI